MLKFPPRVQNLRYFALLLAALIMLLSITALSTTANAQAFQEQPSLEISFAVPPKEPVPVYVLAGQSSLIVFDQPIGRLAVSNTDIAEAVLVAPNQMMINGKVAGRARFTAWSKNTTQFVFCDVDVRTNLAQLDSQVRALFPTHDVRLSQANGAVVISGNIPPHIAKQVEDVIKAAKFPVVNLVTQQGVENIPQIQLQIRIAEVQRNKLNELALSTVYQGQPGVGGYSNTGSGPYTLGNVDGGSIVGAAAQNLNIFGMARNAFVFLRALQSQGALRNLAEPNLVTMNGTQASFLAGGEIPIPIVGGLSGVSIAWKEYGVRLNFKPTILDENHIRLEIEPEVSSLDYSNALRLSGFLIPALRVRRVKNSIELQDGQSFGIAGLLDNSETKSLARVPVLADIPIIGNLFKSKAFQKNETEIVFFVTAKLVRPLNPDSLPPLKGIDDIRNGSPLGYESGEGVSNGKGAAGAAMPALVPVPPATAPTDAAAPPPATEGATNPPAGTPAATTTPPAEGTPPATESAPPPANPPPATDGSAPPPAETPAQNGGEPAPAEPSAGKDAEKGKDGKEDKDDKDKDNKDKDKEKPAKPERIPAQERAVNSLVWMLKMPEKSAAKQALTAERRP